MSIPTTHQDARTAERVDRTPHHRRVAGLAGVGAFAAWLLQPLIVFVLTGGEDRLDYAALEAMPWAGAYEVATFTLMGAGLLVLVLTVADLAAAGGRAPGTLERVGHLLGLTGAFGWLLQAAFAHAPFTTGSSDLATMDLADQASALAIYGVVQIGALGLSTLGSGGWLLVLGARGVRHGVLGRPSAAFALVCGVLAIVPFAVPFGPPMGVLAVFLAALVLGTTFLVASRRRA
ncbi:hypothetical protein GCM10028777_16320 [Angustibacter speluncae]